MKKHWMLSAAGLAIALATGPAFADMNAAKTFLDSEIKDQSSLTRADQAAAFHRRRLQHRVQHEDDAQLQDGEDHQEEGNGDHGEFHGGRAFAPALRARRAWRR